MKRFTNFAIWLAVVFCPFYFLAHLSVITSLLLAFFFAATLDSASVSAKKPTFMPHMVKFNPSVYKMLNALNLVTPEEWKIAFETEASTDPWSGDYLCRRGMYAYGLFLDDAGDTVVHWPKLGIYTEGFALSVELEMFRQDDGSSAFSEWSPRVVIRRTRKGYGIGIDVRSAWWETYGSTLPSVSALPHDTDYSIGRTVVYFAVLPHQALWEFSIDHKTMKSVDMKAVLETAGWVLPDDSHLSEISHLHPPTDYVHMYVTVETNHLHHR